MGEDIAENVARLRERIAAAAARSGRTEGDITLVAVAKRKPAALVAAALAAGVSDIGENYVQEAVLKRAELVGQGIPVPRWHLLGHLQTNKAKPATEIFDLIQSVDSIALASALSRQSERQNKQQSLLLQVHLGNEETKFGLPPEQALDAAAEVAALPGVRVEGLMGIAPAGEEARPHFRALRQIFDRLPAAQRQTLSLGMTGDFEAAIEEGATLVRIGTAIFGARD